MKEWLEKKKGGRKEEGVMCNTHNYYTQLCALQISYYVYNLCYTLHRQININDVAKSYDCFSDIHRV